MRLYSLFKNVVLQLFYDKRTLFLMMLAPILLLSLIHAVFNDNNTFIKVGTYNLDTKLVKELEKKDITIIKYQDNKAIESKIEKDDLVSFINYQANEYMITHNNIDVNETNRVKSSFNTSLLSITNSNLTNKLSQMQKQLNIKDSISKPTLSNKYVYLDENATFYDKVAPFFTSFFVFFFVFIISGIALINERNSRTLEKMLCTPIKRSEIIIGYMLGYGFYAIIQSIIIMMYSINVLKMSMVGDIYLVLLINILVAFSALAIGTTVSTFAKSEFQVMQFVPIIIVPQVFFSGIIDIESMASWLQVFAKCLPLYYASDAISQVMIEGKNFNDVKELLAIIVVFITGFSILNVLLLKKYRSV